MSGPSSKRQKRKHDNGERKELNPENCERGKETSETSEQNLVPGIGNTSATLRRHAKPRTQPRSDHHLLYKYRLLKTSRSIRVLKLLPGSSDELIQVTLHHLQLSSNPNFAAVSYEWGEATRRHPIFCGGKVLKVTTNLLAMLRELQASQENRALWIDAISINQDDVVERSQQVPLMRQIYQSAAIVLIWLGQEQSFTGGSLEIISHLALKFDLLSSVTELRSTRLGEFKTASQIPFGSELAALTSTPAWIGVRDIVSTRSYFFRLWIIQEIVLSSNATLLCGPHRIQWETFEKAVYLIFYCHFREGSLDDLTNLSTITSLSDMKSSFGDGSLDLEYLVISFPFSQASDPRDRIFGLLGMLPPGSQQEIVVDYTKPAEQVYQQATELIIVKSQRLFLWNFLSWQPDRLPSWVPDFSQNFAHYQLPELEFMKKTDPQITIQQGIITVHGFILDLIVLATENFSAENIKRCVQSVLNGTTWSIVENKADGLTTLWQALIAFQKFENDYEILEQQFFCLISRWTLQDLGITQHDVGSNRRLKDLAKYHPALREEYPLEVQNNILVRDLISANPKLKWMCDQRKIGNGKEFELLSLNETCYPDLSMTRNLFKCSQDYVGIGPGSSDKSVQKSSPVVQVGDYVAILESAITPVILRPSDNGLFTLVGPSYISLIEDLPCFKEGEKPPLVPIRIR